MSRRILWAIAIIVLLVPVTGCFGSSTPPDLKNQTAKLDLARAQYSHGKTLYNQGNFTAAKAEFKEVIPRFMDNKTAFEEVARAETGQLEKNLATKMSKTSEQYAYAAAFMRDAADAAASGDKAKAYAIEVNAEEFDLVAGMSYDNNRNQLNELWSSKK